MHMRTQAAALLIASTVLFACSGEETGTSKDGPTPTAADTTAWSCGTKGERIVCTAAVEDTNAPSGAALRCGADQSLKCPATSSLQGSRAVTELLERKKRSPADLETLPWACLATGKHQQQCVRDTGAFERGSARKALASSGGPESESSGDESSPSNDDGSSSPSDGPSPPVSCDPSAWEAYFVDLATFEYGKDGIEISFPREIFDSSKSMSDLAVASAFVKSTPGAPSCHSAEWSMREQAWLDAVTQGCTELNNAITVLCQQASNYAPNTGKCNATGSW